MKRIVIVGGSLAGHHAAVTLRQRGYDGSVTVIGSERHHPYDRFPLSKAFLTGKMDRRGIDLARDVPNIDWRLGAAATRVDLGAGRVALDTGEKVPFDGLVVAAGARPRNLDQVDGVDGAFTFRDVEDAVRLKEALEAPNQGVVVVGGGLIGAELAATAVAQGHHTTLVHPGEIPTVHAVGRPVARHLLSLHREAGVELAPRSRVRSIDTEQGKATGVVLEDGSSIPADVVVMATGTEPNVEWLRGNGLSTDGGLLCTGTLFAVDSSWIVGAGDVIRAPHPVLGPEPVRVEHWAATRDQAALAVENLLAGPSAAWRQTALPEFGTTIHGARLRCVGFPQAADGSRLIWGSLETGAAVFELTGCGRPVGLISVNATPELDRIAVDMWPDHLPDRIRSGPVRTRAAHSSTGG